MEAAPPRAAAECTPSPGLAAPGRPSSQHRPFWRQLLPWERLLQRAGSAEAGERQRRGGATSRAPQRDAGGGDQHAPAARKTWLCRETPPAGKRTLRAMRLWCGPVCASGCYALFSGLTMCAGNRWTGDRAPMAGGKWAPNFFSCSWGTHPLASPINRAPYPSCCICTSEGAGAAGWRGVCAASQNGGPRPPGLE